MNETESYIAPELEIVQISLESSALQGISNRSFNEDEDDIFENN